VALVTRADETALPSDQPVGRRPVRLAFGTELLDGVVVHGDEEFAGYLRLALSAQEGHTLNMDQLLNIHCPNTPEEALALGGELDRLNERDPAAERDHLLDQLDALVGGSLNLDPSDIAEIQRDLSEDPFLRALKVREPHTATRVLGVRENLARADRYERL
jgi:hypothetical protein